MSQSGSNLFHFRMVTGKMRGPVNSRLPFHKYPDLFGIFPGRIIRFPVVHSGFISILYFQFHGSIHRPIRQFGRPIAADPSVGSWIVGHPQAVGLPQNLVTQTEFRIGGSDKTLEGFGRGAKRPIPQPNGIMRHMGEISDRSGRAAREN
jgi:hypothetical protein